MKCKMLIWGGTDKIIEYSGSQKGIMQGTEGIAVIHTQKNIYIYNIQSQKN